MGELGALFNPGMRHELEERRARAARREEEGSARDGDLRIDLESGVAVINAPGDEGSVEADQTALADGENAAEARTGSEASESADPDTNLSFGAESTSAGTADSGTSDSGTTDSGTAGEPAEAAPPPLRPRGKRAMSATRR
jgi:hypothetical protein